MRQAGLVPFKATSARQCHTGSRLAVCAAVGSASLGSGYAAPHASARISHAVWAGTKSLILDGGIFPSEYGDTLCPAGVPPACCRHHEHAVIHPAVLLGWCTARKLGDNLVQPAQSMEADARGAHMSRLSARARWVWCAYESPAVAGPGLETLPEDVLRRILGALEPRDAINLLAASPAMGSANRQVLVDLKAAHQAPGSLHVQQRYHADPNMHSLVFVFHAAGTVAALIRQPCVASPAFSTAWWSLLHEALQPQVMAAQL